MIYMPFLYFPEDKSEYIPATIMLLLFMAIAVATFVFIIKKNNKDEKQFEEKYQTQLKAAEEENKAERTDK